MRIHICIPVQTFLLEINIEDGEQQIKGSRVINGMETQTTFQFQLKHRRFANNDTELKNKLFFN